MKKTEPQAAVAEPVIEESVAPPVIEESVAPPVIEESVAPSRHPVQKKQPSVRELESQINELLEMRNQIDREITVVNRALHQARVREQVVQTPKADTEARVAYIRSQAELRANRRAAQVAALQGINLRDLNPNAPIDQAMQRRSQRGAQRPQIPLPAKKEE